MVDGRCTGTYQDTFGVEKTYDFIVKYDTEACTGNFIAKSPVIPIAKESSYIRGCHTCEYRGEYDADERARCLLPAGILSGLKVTKIMGKQCGSFKEDPSLSNLTCEDCKYFTGEGKDCTDPGEHTALILKLRCDGFAQKIPPKTVGEILREKIDSYMADSNQQKGRETSIMSNAIIRLADSQFNKEVVELGGSNIGLSSDLKEALAELQEKDRKESAKAAATEVMNLLKLAEGHIERKVEVIQNARRQEALAKKEILDFQKARAYGLATNNFVPLAVLTGHIWKGDISNKSLLEIDESKLPEGWDKKPEAK
jgi:hypothetical protein